MEGLKISKLTELKIMLANALMQNQYKLAFQICPAILKIDPLDKKVLECIKVLPLKIKQQELYFKKKAKQNKESSSSEEELEDISQEESESGNEEEKKQEEEEESDEEEFDCVKYRKKQAIVRLNETQNQPNSINIIEKKQITQNISQ